MNVPWHILARANQNRQPVSRLPISINIHLRCDRKHLIHGLRIQAVVVYKILILHQLFLPIVIPALRVSQLW